MVTALGGHNRPISKQLWTPLFAVSLGVPVDFMGRRNNMNAKLLRDELGGRTFALVFDPGDEPLSGLEHFAAETGLEAAHFTAIGAFRSATLGFFDRDSKDYQRIEVSEQTEVLSLAGNIALHENKPKVHAHVVLGKRDGTAHGGHLMEAEVWPTLEVILNETPSHLRRRLDPQTGLPLIRV